MRKGRAGVLVGGSSGSPVGASVPGRACEGDDDWRARGGDPIARARGPAARAGRLVLGVTVEHRGEDVGRREGRRLRPASAFPARRRRVRRRRRLLSFPRANTIARRVTSGATRSACGEAACDKPRRARARGTRGGDGRARGGDAREGRGAGTRAIIITRRRVERRARGSETKLRTRKFTRLKPPCKKSTTETDPSRAPRQREPARSSGIDHRPLAINRPHILRYLRHCTPGPPFPRSPPAQS